MYGDGVNVASRVRPLAEPGGICVSEQVYDSVKNQPNVEATSLGPKELKNVVRPIEVFAIGEGTAAVRTPSQPSRGQHRVRTVLAAAGGVILVVAIATWATWPRPLAATSASERLLYKKRRDQGPHRQPNDRGDKES